MRSRDDDRALALHCEDRGDVEHVLRFEPEVELLDDRLGEELDQRGWVGESGDRDAADQHRCDPRHGRDVEADEGGHGAPLDLDHHPFSRPEGRGVHLGDRCGGHRSAVEGDEDLREGTTEFLLDGAANRRERLGRDPVAQQAELGDQLLGEDAFARGDDLAELDVGRTESLEGRPQPPRKTGPRLRGAAIADPPGEQRPPEAPPDREDPAHRGHALGPHQPVGERRRPPAEHVDLTPRVEGEAPAHRRRIDDPRAVGGERADREVGVARPRLASRFGTGVTRAGARRGPGVSGRSVSHRLQR